MSKGVSVIICCYNSSKRLRETLRHLTLQVFTKKTAWEIIVIDNASTDETANIAIQEWQALDARNIEFKVVTELKTGKINALKRGCFEAAFDYVLVCDDDNWLNENYIQTAFDLIDEDQKIGIIGGKGVFEPEEPLNFEIKNFESIYVNGSQVWAPSQHWVYGAGSIFRKKIYENLVEKGWQMITSGRVGNKLNGGEDVEMCFMFYLMGYKIIASDQLIFKHFVPASRQSLDYIININYWLSYSNVLLNSYFSILNNTGKPLKTILNWWLYRVFKAHIKYKLQFISNYTFGNKVISTEKKIRINSNLGTLHCLQQNRMAITKHHHLIKLILQSNKL